MISIRGLTKIFGGQVAVDNLSLEIPSGGIVGLLGPNGAGKSTTLKILTGLLAPTSGAVRVDGYDVLTDPIEVRRRIGYLPEGAPLYDEMLVRPFLEFMG